MTDKLFHLLATAALPDGYQPYEGRGTIVIEMDKQGPRPSAPHWYDHHPLVKPLVVAYRTFQRGNDGKWKVYQRDPAHPAETILKDVSSLPPRGAWLITPSSTLPPPPISPPQALGDGSTIVFLTRLRGPPGIAKQIQDLAINLKKKSGVAAAIVTAFDVEWTPQLKVQGFCVTRSWDYFHQCVLQGTNNRAWRNFYEIIPDNVPVRFYLDFDLKYREYPTLPEGASPAHISSVLEKCIQQAYGRHYRGQPALTLHLLDSSNQDKFSLHVIGNVVWPDTGALRILSVKSGLRSFRTSSPSRRRKIESPWLI
jgi:hypothetical protein